MTNYSTIYYKQCALLIKVLPYINDMPCFALKGGTAINFFYQNMPRLSIDIDLTYTPLLPREQSLLEINQTMLSIAQRIQNNHPEIKAVLRRTVDAVVPKLQIQTQEAIIKIEVNPIFRGTVFPIEERPLCDMAQILFESYFTIKSLSLAEVYAGKFCAALSRQHPRDLFDVKLLLSNQDITKEMRQAFVIYLACGARPLHELLTPNIKPYELQQKIHQNEFMGMVVEKIDYQHLANVVTNLSMRIRSQLVLSEKEFLLSVAEGMPKWELMPFSHLKQLPALQWKLLNINKMDAPKRKECYRALEICFEEKLEKEVIASVT